MTIRANQSPVQALIVPQHIFVSVFGKTDLPLLVQGLVDINPNAHFYSTGGTGKTVVKLFY